MLNAYAVAMISVEESSENNMKFIIVLSQEEVPPTAIDSFDVSKSSVEHPVISSS